MPLYYVQCKACGAPDKRVVEPSQVAGLVCRTCGGKVKRTPKPPTSMLKERVDTGLMPKTLENYVDGHELTKARSVLDLSKPDWQKSDE